MLRLMVPRGFTGVGGARLPPVSLLSRRRFNTAGLPKATSAAPASKSTGTTIPKRRPEGLPRDPPTTSSSAASSPRTPGSFGVTSAKGESSSADAWGRATRNFGGLHTRFFSSPSVTFLRENVQGLAIYQLCFEVVITGFCMWMISTGRWTPAGIQRRIEKYGVKWLIDMDTCVWTEDVSLGREGFKVSKEKATLFSQAHAFSVAVLPLQVIIVLSTYRRISTPLFALARSLKPAPSVAATAKAAKRVAKA